MLDNLKYIIDGLQALNTEQIVIDIVEDNKERITELQKEQMLEGRGVDGELIRPLYSENPFFKSKASALRYAEWKQRIAPNPLRPMDAPNLYIDGTFHRSLVTKIQGDIFRIDSESAKGAEILSVHSNASGLDADKRDEFATEITLPQFALKLEEKTTIRL